MNHKQGAEKERVQNLCFSVRGGPMTGATSTSRECETTRRHEQCRFTSVFRSSHFFHLCLSQTVLLRELYEETHFWTLFSVVPLRSGCAGVPPHQKTERNCEIRGLHICFNFPPNCYIIVQMSTVLSVHFSNIEVTKWSCKHLICNFLEIPNINRIFAFWVCRTTRSSKTMVPNSFFALAVTF